MFIGIAVFAFAVVTAVTYIRGGYVKARLEDAEANAKSLREDVDDYIRRVNERDAKIEVLEAKVQEQARTIQVLESLKTGSEALARIEESLTKHNKEDIEIAQKILAAIKENGT